MRLICDAPQPQQYATKRPTSKESFMNAMTQSALAQLTGEKQAVWLDFLSREFIQSGGLKKYVDECYLTGVTSNPSIFEQAIGHGSDYDEQLYALLDQADRAPGELYEELAIQDIQMAADVLRPVYERLQGQDGYVSLEVSPYLANDTEATLEEARRLWLAVDRANLMIKVPGTPAGTAAIRQLITEGINVNVTLLFSRLAYHEVAYAYLDGLTARLNAGQDIRRVASVASFFVSRIDTRLDQRIDAALQQPGADTTALNALKGKVAIANAKLAYQDYLKILQDDRWQNLAKQGAQPQRLLWASTGTKNKAYPPTLYVDELIGPDTVNTMPRNTLDAFSQTGKVAPTLTQEISQAQGVLETAERLLAIDLEEVTRELVDAGAQLFCDAADNLLTAIALKRLEHLGDGINQTTYHLPPALDHAVGQTLERARQSGWVRSLWQGDAAALWPGQGEDRLGWLAAGQGRQIDVSAIAGLVRTLAADKYSHAVLLGMGGSSLGPEVLARTLGSTGRGLTLYALDSTNPEEIRAVEAAIDMTRTLFIVSSKSGSTLEPELLRAHFYASVAAAQGAAAAGQHFIAITDPGSDLERFAQQHGYRAIFQGDPAIGGRYSVLSVFGMVPLGVMGHDVADFLHKTQPMVRACGPSSPPQVNPGVYLGIVLGEAAQAGCNKLTILTSSHLTSMGSWLEQLLAESTGKDGKGIIPVDLEPLSDTTTVYGNDRIFVYLRCTTDHDAGAALDAKVQALADAGHPVISIALSSPHAIGQEFFRWEIATAIVGAVLGINPFDQPDVEASKVQTHTLIEDFKQTGKLTHSALLVQDEELLFYGDENLRDRALKAGHTSVSVLKAHFARLQAGDYAAVLAYIARNAAYEQQLIALRRMIRDRYHVATVGGFGPRFLHSTGQAYKGGPNQGVFLQITADSSPGQEVRVPDANLSFGTVHVAQALGDLQVLAQRGRRYLHVHIKDGNIQVGLAHLMHLFEQALRGS
jgi:transaldolase/glucose-6-phosphate isomerase